MNNRLIYIYWIFFNRGVLGFLSALMCSKKYHRFFKRKLYTYQDVRFFRSVITPYGDYNILCPAKGSGDLLLIGGLITEFQKKECKKTIVLVRSQYHYDVLALYLKDIDFEIKIINPRYRVHKSFKVFMYDIGIYADSPFQFNNMLHGYRSKLGLDKSVKLQLPTITVNELANSIFASKNLKKGRTVLISPSAESFPSILSQESWCSIGALMVGLGYDVIFNSRDLKYGAYETVFLGPHDTIEFARLSGNYIGCRSGLCDLIVSMTRVNALVIYMHKVKGRYSTEEFFRVFNLAQIYSNVNVEEFVYEDHTQVMRTVDSRFKSI